MAKKVKKEEELKAIMAEPEVATEETPEPKTKEGKFPVVAATGKFQAVAFKDGYLVYNQYGVRVSDVVNEVEAHDIVTGSNQAAGLK